jgi:hypothetical protein
MSCRTIISVAVAALLAITSLSTEALAYRGGARGGVHRGGAVAYHGGTHRDGYWHHPVLGSVWHRPVGVWSHPVLGAAAGVGAAIGTAAAGSYYNNFYDSTYGYGTDQPNYYASANGMYQPNLYGYQPSFSNYNYGPYQPSYGYGGYLGR